MTAGNASRRESGESEPTDAPAGSEAKIAVLMQRAQRQQPLFHPEDSREIAGNPSRRTGTVASDLPKGIWYDPRRKRFRVRLRVSGKGSIYVGVFATLQEAIQAADEFTSLGSGSGSGRSAAQDEALEGS